MTTHIRCSVVEECLTLSSNNSVSTQYSDNVGQSYERLLNQLIVSILQSYQQLKAKQ